MTPLQQAADAAREALAEMDDAECYADAERELRKLLAAVDERLALDELRANYLQGHGGYAGAFEPSRCLYEAVLSDDHRGNYYAVIAGAMTWFPTAVAALAWVKGR